MGDKNESMDVSSSGVWLSKKRAKELQAEQSCQKKSTSSKNKKRKLSESHSEGLLNSALNDIFQECDNHHDHTAQPKKQSKILDFFTIQQKYHDMAECDTTFDKVNEDTDTWEMNGAMNVTPESEQSVLLNDNNYMERRENFSSESMLEYEQDSSDETASLPELLTDMLQQSHNNNLTQESLVFGTKLPKENEDNNWLTASELVAQVSQLPLSGETQGNPVFSGITDKEVIQNKNGGTQGDQVKGTDQEVIQNVPGSQGNPVNGIDQEVIQIIQDTSEFSPIFNIRHSVSGFNNKEIEVQTDNQTVIKEEISCSISQSLSVNNQNSLDLDNESIAAISFKPISLDTQFTLEEYSQTF